MDLLLVFIHAMDRLQLITKKSMESVDYQETAAVLSRPFDAHLQQYSLLFWEVYFTACIGNNSNRRAVHWFSQKEFFSKTSACLLLPLAARHPPLPPGQLSSLG